MGRDPFTLSPMLQVDAHDAVAELGSDPNSSGHPHGVSRPSPVRNQATKTIIDISVQAARLDLIEALRHE